MPNHTLAEHIIYAEELIWVDPMGTPGRRRVSKAARILFFHIWIAMDNHHRLYIGPSPATPTFLKSACHPAEPDVRIPDVARCLDELRRSGAVAVRDSDRGWYVEVSERLRYRREDYREGQPKYGPRTAPKPEQQTLGLGPVALSKNVEHPEKVPRGEGGIQMDRSRLSFACTDPPALLRADSPGIVDRMEKREGSARFARSVGELTGCPLGQRLAALLGPAEMRHQAQVSGTFWLGLLREERAVLADLLDEVERCAVEMPDPRTRAKYVAKRIKDRRAA